GAVSGMPAIRETGPGKNLQAITVSTRCDFVDRISKVHPARRSQHVRRSQTPGIRSQPGAAKTQPGHAHMGQRQRR
ncbi:hypothetical protein C9189_25350, partial [Escherichia coli]